MRRKQKMDENTAKTRSRRVATGGEKRAAKDASRHADKVERSSKRRGRVSLPLVRSKLAGTVALNNVKIFEIIPFP